MFGMLFEYIANLFCQFFLSGYVAGNYAFPKPLSAQEEREYLRRCKAGDEEARGILIEHNLRLVALLLKNILQPQATTRTICFYRDNRAD